MTTPGADRPDCQSCVVTEGRWLAGLRLVKSLKSGVECLQGRRTTGRLEGKQRTLAEDLDGNSATGICQPDGIRGYGRARIDAERA